MREVAWAVCVSVGGLYHYFPAKRDLLLYGLNPEAHTFLCRRSRGATRRYAVRLRAMTRRYS